MLVVYGDIDLTTAPYLIEAIDAAVAEMSAGLVIDLSAVSFLASVGMTVLIDAVRRLPDGALFGVVADGPATGRPMKLMGLDRELRMYADTASAIIALHEGTDAS